MLGTRPYYNNLPAKKPLKTKQGSLSPSKKPVALSIPKDYSGVVNWAGNKFHYFNGVIHRKKGPAIEYSNGSVEFWLNGSRVEFDEWKARVGRAYLDQVKEYAEENSKLKKELEALKTKIGSMSPPVEIKNPTPIPVNTETEVEERARLAKEYERREVERLRNEYGKDECPKSTSDTEKDAPVPTKEKRNLVVD